MIYNVFCSSPRYKTTFIPNLLHCMQDDSRKQLSMKKQHKPKSDLPDPRGRGEGSQLTRRCYAAFQMRPSHPEDRRGSRP